MGYDARESGVNQPQCRPRCLAQHVAHDRFTGREQGSRHVGKRETFAPESLHLVSPDGVETIDYGIFLWYSEATCSQGLMSFFEPALDGELAVSCTRNPL